MPEHAAISAEEAALEALLAEDEPVSGSEAAPKECDKLQAELQAMTVKQLKQRARDLGVDEDTIHDIDDADDVKAAAIQMVVDNTPAPQPEPDEAAGRGQLKHSISLHPPPGGGVMAGRRHPRPPVSV